MGYMHFYGDLADCYRCFRRIVLLPVDYPAATPGALMVWRPSGEGVRYDRADCPERNGERCSPYPPEGR